MRSTAFDLCMCGSRLPFLDCHGNPDNDYAREAALREAEAVAGLFPSVRATGREIDAFLDRLAAGPGEVDDAPVAEGLPLVAKHEYRRVVNSWALPYADRWESLAHASGDTLAAERALVLGALRVGLLERASAPLELLELVDRSGLRSPFPALALVLPPMLVWSRDEAGAGLAAAAGRRKLAQRQDAIEQVAYALASFEHLRRTRALAERLASELPVAGLPRASELLGEACRDAELDVDAARTAAAALLIAYVEQIALRGHV